MRVAGGRTHWREAGGQCRDWAAGTTHQGPTTVSCIPCLAQPALRRNGQRGAHTPAGTSGRLLPASTSPCRPPLPQEGPCTRGQAGCPRPRPSWTLTRKAGTPEGCASGAASPGSAPGTAVKPPHLQVHTTQDPSCHKTSHWRRTSFTLHSQKQKLPSSLVAPSLLVPPAHQTPASAAGTHPTPHTLPGQSRTDYTHKVHFSRGDSSSQAGVPRHQE